MPVERIARTIERALFIGALIHEFDEEPGYDVCVDPDYFWARSAWRDASQAGPTIAQVANLGLDVAHHELDEAEPHR